MFPLREVRDPSSQAPRLAPTVTYALLASNVVAFAFERMGSAASRAALFSQWGLVPRAFDDGRVGHGLLTVFTSMFLHASWFHLIGNLWFLRVFGPSVEDALGHVRFAALFLLGGAAAAAVHVGVDSNALSPVIGASGAIGAVLAAYVSLFPRRRITTVVPIVVIPLLFSIPALLFVVEWFAINLFQGIGALDAGTTSGVAWWAHIGGFFSGLVLVRLLFPRNRARDDEGDYQADADGELVGRRRSAYLPVHGGDVVVRGEDGRRYGTSRGQADYHEAE